MRFDQIPIVFLQGSGRSGSDLLRTLLDGHEEIIVFPFNDKFSSTWIDNQLDENSSIQEVVQKVLYSSKVINFRDEIYINRGAKQDYSMIKWSKYEDYFIRYLSLNKVSSRSARLAIYYAFASVLNKDLDKLKVIIADAYYSDYTKFVLKDFPDARFMHLLKDHRANIHSLKQYYRKSLGSMYPLSGNIKNVFLNILEDYMVTNMKMLHNNITNLNDKLKIVKYEEILNNPEQTLKKLSGWLGVTYTSNLLKTTRVGKPSISHSAFSENGITGINPQFADRWRKEMPASEVRMIEYLFEDSMERLEYERVYPRNLLNRILGFLSCFLPWKGEIIPYKKALRQSRFGEKGQLFWYFSKYIIYIFYSLINFPITRIRFFLSLFGGTYKF